jgi:hypothetical protein
MKVEFSYAKKSLPTDRDGDRIVFPNKVYKLLHTVKSRCIFIFLYRQLRILTQAIFFLDIHLLGLIALRLLKKIPAVETFYPTIQNLWIESYFANKSKFRDIGPAYFDEIGPSLCKKQFFCFSLCYLSKWKPSQLEASYYIIGIKYV